MEQSKKIWVVMIATILVFIAFSGHQAVKITRLSIPNFILNGSRESVLLDCEYLYNPDADKMLVVKWFHEDDAKPVYQWIQELGTFHFEERYRISGDYGTQRDNKGKDQTRISALNISRPTTELSGRYSCHVQSLDGADIKEDSMIIYALPDYVNLNYTTIDGFVIVYCEVESVYPLPLISLFEILPGEVDESPIDDVYLDYNLQNGSYDVILSTNISERDLVTDGLIFFGCSVELNGTDYTKVIKVPYFPVALAEKQEGFDHDSDSGSRHQSSVPLAALCILLLFFT